MINGRKSGRSRGRRKICCGAAALASCLPLCLSAAEAEDFKEVHAPLTISGAAHNSVTALFAVQGIINTSLVITLNIIFLAVMKIGLTGYVLSVVLADFLCTVFL